MSENFNPYVEWLGLATNVASPDHYQLLGLDESVTDPAVIASAADRAMTRVRACKPGGHAAAWAKLLDRITEAKATLTDPAHRAKYDQQRKNDPAGLGGDTLDPMAPVGSGQTPNAAAIDPMAPITPSLPPSTADVLPPSMPPGAQMPGPWPTAAQPSSAADPMAPLAPISPNVPLHPAASPTLPDPMAAMAPLAPVAQPIPVAPSPIAPTPIATVPHSASPTMTASPSATAAPVVRDKPKLKRKSSVAARAHSRSGGLFLPILLGGSVGGLILLVVGVGFYLANTTPPAPPTNVAAAPSTPAIDSVGGAGSTLPRRLDEIPESERPQPEPYVPPTPQSELPAMEPLTPQPMMTPEPAPAMTPAAMDAPPTSAEPEPMMEAEPTAAELRALAQSLTTARTAIGELNLDIADRELAKAEETATKDDHKAKLRRLKLLRDYVGRYKTAISTTLARLQSGEEIKFDNNLVINIIEVNGEQLIIRVAGQRREYSIATMPAGLSTRLAEMSLDPAMLDTTVMKAAFVSVNPRASDSDLEKAKGWWEETASVSEVPDLVMAINDDYNLKQDILAVAMDDNDLTALAARAGRLKDARKIEDFASEYQAAIDESLKTLDPETELSVGGSTTVVVQELKTDRLMLTVADETRGFQLTKLPLGLAASIAERILPRDAPLTMVMKGAYFAARDKTQSNRQFRPMVLEWWREAGEMDPQLQPVIQELANQYPQ